MSVTADPGATPAAERGAAGDSHVPSRGQLHAVIDAQRILACAPPDPVVIFQLLAEAAWSVLGCDGTITSQPTSDSLVVRGLAGETPSDLGSTIPLDGTLTGVAVRTGTSQICSNWTQDPRTGIKPLGVPLSSIVVPLVFEDGVIAAVSAHCSGIDAFDGHDLELLAMLAEVGANRLAHALTLSSRDELQAQSSAVLDDTHRRLAAALDLAGLATWEVDVATGLVYWSPEMFAMFGLEPSSDPPDEALQASVVEDEDRRALEAMATACMATRKPGHAIVRARWPDGTRRYLDSQMDVATDAAGDVVTLWGNSQDITEQEEASRVLAASEQHFRVAFDNAPIGMSMIDLAPGSEGRYLRANPEFCTMLGYSMDELPTLTMADLTHVDDVEQDIERFARINRGDTTTISFDKRFRCKDGHTVFAWLTSSVAQSPAGDPLYLITHAVDMTAQRRQQAELERLALSDTLTGLANRTLLTDRLDQALARLKRADHACALLLLDLDRFKLVNDSFGHQVGDALLVEVAARLKAITRADSTVARLGGDEFVLLVEGLKDSDDVQAFASRLLETLRQPYSLGDATDSIVATMSIGIAVATSSSRSHSDLYREADLALYRAKDAGRDQYAMFDDALRARVTARMESETLLRRALAENLVTPYFQPIVDLSGGRIIAVESLARIQLPGRDVICPVEFIDVAEETGLIVELDARMFELGSRQFAQWSAEGLPLRHFSTNVSARSLEDPGFVDRMRQAMATYDVAGGAIRVEITEHSLMAPSPVVVESLRRIAELGIDIGLDDFGTGYSALAYLQNFDLKFLKIDRSFVSRLGLSGRDNAVVSAVIDLAHAHELIVVAEGVETGEQLDRLRDMGCDRAQGFLMGRPLPPDKLVELMRNDPRW